MANETLSGLTRVAGTLATRDTTVGNITTGVDTLQTYTLPANEMSSDGDVIEITAAGTLANNTNNKEIRLVLGTTQLISSGVAAQQAGDFVIRATILRTGAATQRSASNYGSTATNGTTVADYVAATEDFTTALGIFLTGEATATNDITNTMLVVRVIPSAVAD